MKAHGVKTIGFFVFFCISLMAVIGYGILPGFKRLPADAEVDFILVEKGKRTLSLIHQGETLTTYRVSLGSTPVGPKRCTGDSKTPEGTYTIDYRNN